MMFQFLIKIYSLIILTLIKILKLLNNGHSQEDFTFMTLYQVKK